MTSRSRLDQVSRAASILLLGILSTLLAVPAPAMSLELYVEGRALSTPEVRATMRAHFTQVVIWVGTVQGFLDHRSRTPLLCAPPGFDLGPEDAMLLIDGELRRQLARKAIMPPKTPVEIVLLDALERAYPCPRA